MKAELKEAFRVYDKDGAGFITTGDKKYSEMTSHNLGSGS